VEYEALFAGKKHDQISGEASTNYLYDAGAARRIYEFMPQVKIIILLRNPVERLRSAWGHTHYQSGEEPLALEEALQAEEERIASAAFRKSCAVYYGNFHYFNGGLYYQQVKRYRDLFGPEQMRIYLFEEFAGDPAAVCEDVFSFLGVDATFTPVFEKHNVAPGLRFRSLQRFLVRPPAILQKLYQALPVRVRLVGYRVGKFVYGLNLKRVERPSLSPELAADLLVRYRPDIEKLERLLDRDLSLWYANHQSDAS